VDLSYLERMRAVEHADRRPAAILMADLEASSPLARRLSTALYFAFVRGLIRAWDRWVVDAGGIVGRHAGDGVVAFFLPETIGSESAAARSSIVAARSLRDSLTDTQRAPRSLHPSCHCGSDSIGARRCTSGESSQPDEAKSPPSATK
jgi:class 3 adenylate cyclase